MAGKPRKSIRPRGHSPVIAVRVSEPLYERIKASAKRSKVTMSEEMSALLSAAFEWREAFGSVKQLMASGTVAADSNFEAEMRRRGWKRNHGTPYWFKGDTRDAFEIGAALEREDAESELNKIDAALDDIERRIASLRAKRKERA